MKHGTTETLKFLRLMRRLGTSKRETVGILELLWHATIRNTPAGDIGRLTNEEIAVVCDWENDHDELVEALTETGWLDACDTHRLVVHDWADHSPTFVKGNLARHSVGFAVAESTKQPTKQRAKQPTKQGAKQPTKQRAENGAENGADSSFRGVENDVMGENGSFDASAKHVTKQPTKQPTKQRAKQPTKQRAQGTLLPNLTKPNLTKQNKTKRLSSPGGDGVCDDPFSEFWDVVPRKTGKQAARKEFTKAVRDVARDRMIEPSAAARYVIDRMREFAASDKAKSEFCPHPATWLRSGCYDDDPREWQNRKSSKYTTNLPDDLI